MPAFVTNSAVEIVVFTPKIAIFAISSAAVIVVPIAIGKRRAMIAIATEISYLSGMKKGRNGLKVSAMYLIKSKPYVYISCL